MRRFVYSFLLVLASVATLSAQEPAVFRGEDGNWFNPRNWSTGQVPGPRTDVVIQHGYAVVIDPALTDGPVVVRDLWILSGGSLTTKPGTKISTRNEFVAGGSLVHQSTESIGDFFFATNPDPAGCAGCGIKFNPSPKQKRIIVLQSSVQVEFGLGGTIAAGPGATGRGHYATLTTDWGMIAGELKVNLHYGFTPQAGDAFTIIKSNGLVLGTFNGLREGALVETFGDVGLFISYRGGHGSDVVLTARAIR
jgi:hypothetical protein